MSVRRADTEKRLTLCRECGTCGKAFSTTADTPWVRQIERDGKRQATTYFCSSKCYQASYKHIGWYDGLTWQRKIERDRKRTDSATRSAAYYATHREELKAKARQRYAENKAYYQEVNRFSRNKRKLLYPESVGESRKIPVIGTNIADGTTVNYQSMAEAKADGFTPSKISACVLGKRKTHGGYIWKKSKGESEK